MKSVISFALIALCSIIAACNNSQKSNNEPALQEIPKLTAHTPAKSQKVIFDSLFSFIKRNGYYSSEDTVYRLDTAGLEFMAECAYTANHKRLRDLDLVVIATDTFSMTVYRSHVMEFGRKNENKKVTDLNLNVSDAADYLAKTAMLIN